ncbi:hypothetical protein K2173_020390 [Erythroxylum novogranatense]|uniref:Uncharacterized protein n=1 Tax=Erythroxylum novogranatense TaxID=1862640 RepID=A0AAV8TI94_9ROSI|nr:hypothetical protein K2173_020390 [Erythroxylum novogranatense]
MEVRIVSRQLIRPSSLAADEHEKPHKISYFDQLTPTTYSPFILFYSMTQVMSSTNTIRIPDRLKKSLSESLSIYYPFSGRTTDNMFFHSFREGVPFMEARVNCRLTDFIKRHEIESLNLLLPRQPYTKELIESPVLALQLNIFTCGGIALGMSASHKLIDRETWRGFLTTWAALSRGELGNVIHPNFNDASLFFPPRNDIPQNHVSLMENLWFTEANYITRRFVFDVKTISMLKDEAKAKPEARPTTVEVLSCFIWKCCMNASKAASEIPKTSIMVQAVNLRTRTKPFMSNASMGNAFWWATVAADPSDTNKLPELVDLLHEAIDLYNSEFTHTLQGDGGSEAISDLCNQLEQLFDLEKPDIFAFTSWLHVGFQQVNFGWGKPVWFANVGKAGPAFRNLIIFVETNDGKGIEAWITLDEKRMSALEKDPEFLAFASKNRKISSL